MKKINRRKKMKKKIALLLALTMSLSVFAACGSKPAAEEKKEEVKVEEEKKEEKKETPAEEKKEEAKAEEKKEEAPAVEPVKLNVAYMPNYASLWSVLTGIDKGYFAEEGIDITLWEFADGPSEIAAMEGGSIDLAYIGHGAHRLCINGQATIFAPSSVHNTDRIIVLPSSGVTSADDIANLKGKKVAYNAGSSSETALNGALAAAGLTMDDIEAFEMDATNMVAAMLSNSVDACTSWNPYSNQIMAESEGAIELEFATDSVNLSSWICLPSYAEQNRDILERFSRALYKAMDFASQEENYDYVVGLYAKQCAKDPAACQVETGDATWFSASDIKTGASDGYMEKLYARQQEMFLEAGKVDGEVPLEDYVMFDLMKDVLK